MNEKTLEFIKKLKEQRQNPANNEEFQKRLDAIKSRRQKIHEHAAKIEEARMSKNENKRRGERKHVEHIRQENANGMNEQNMPRRHRRHTPRTNK